jgi:hypothetical protein
VLRFFRLNDPYRLIGLWLLLTLASLILLIDLPSMTLQELKGMVLGEAIGNKIMYVEIVDRTPPLMAVTEGFLNFLFGRSLLARHMVALIFIFFQASYFGILLINNKAYNESGYVPSLIFGFLCFFSFDLLATTPELFASTLLLLALNNLFKEIEFRVDRDSIVLNLGVFLGMASLYIFSYTIFLLGAILILIVFARTTFRKIALVLFGFGLVHAILIILYYCYERTDDLWQHFYWANLNKPVAYLIGMNSILVLAALPVLYFVFSLFMLTREAHFTKYQSQLFQTIFLWMTISLIQFWIASEKTPHSLYTVIPAVAYFISHYLLLIRRRGIAEVMFWLFILGLLFVNYGSRYQFLKSVNYESMFPNPSVYEKKIVGKKIMMVGDEPSLYRNNTLGGYFLDWELSRKYFEQPDYYQNIVKINDAVARDKPDIIIDEKGLMGPIVARIPLLEKLYFRDGPLYRRR